MKEPYLEVTYRRDQKGRKAEPKDGFHRMETSGESCQSELTSFTFRRITSLYPPFYASCLTV